MTRAAAISVYALIAAFYVYIACFVLAPKYSWVHPEVAHFDNFTLYNVHSMLKKTFNWKQYEFAPRVTRPLSNYVQIVEGRFRGLLSHSILPYVPTLSLVTFAICLLLNPLLIFHILKLCGMRRLTCLVGFLLGLVNSANLSHLGLYFRPAKPLSEFFFIATVYLYLKHRDQLSRDRRALYQIAGSLLLGFLSDEWGLMAYVFLLLCLLWDFKKVARPLGSLLLVFPVALAVLDFWILPAISTHLWHLEGGLRNYFIFDPILKSEHPLSAAFEMFAKFVNLSIEHFTIFWTQSLGSFPGATPEGGIGVLFHLQTVTLFIALFVSIILLVKRRLSGRNPLLFFVSAVAAILLHSVLMTLTSGTYGPYYYAGQASILIVLFAAMLFDQLPECAILLVTALTLTTSAYAFPFTNLAMKHYHYYPPNQTDFQKMFRGDINRFTLKFSDYDNLNTLLDLESLKVGDCRQVHNEFLWYLTSVKYRYGAGFPPDTDATEVCRKDTRAATVD